MTCRQASRQAGNTALFQPEREATISLAVSQMALDSLSRALLLTRVQTLLTWVQTQEVGTGQGDQSISGVGPPGRTAAGDFMNCPPHPSPLLLTQPACRAEATEMENLGVDSAGAVREEKDRWRVRLMRVLGWKE